MGSEYKVRGAGVLKAMNIVFDEQVLIYILLEMY